MRSGSGSLWAMLVYSGVEGVKRGERGGISLAEALEMLLARLHNGS